MLENLHCHLAALITRSVNNGLNPHTTRTYAPTCNKCVKLLVTEVRRRAAVTPTQKAKRALPSSNALLNISLRAVGCAWFS